MARREGAAGARFGRVLLLIVLVALGIRIAYVAGAKSGPCRIALPNGVVVGSSPSKCTGPNDQVYYNGQANSVADGDGFNEPFWTVSHPGEKAPPAADHPPLTVFVLTPVSWLVDHPPLSWVIDEPLHDHVREHRYTMVFLGTLVVLLIGLLGRRIGGDAVGLVAAGIAAINPNMWVNDGLVMSETVTVLTVVGAMWAALALWERPTLPRAAVLGLVCGLAALGARRADPVRAVARDRRGVHGVEAVVGPICACRRSRRDVGPRDRAVGRLQPCRASTTARSSRRTTASRCSDRTATRSTPATASA